ncbi:MAG: serine/threonine protein kinase [Myxococcales bacterium]|nr:serine/threonine protein kinase [Myxococcales bacterium]
MAVFAKSTAATAEERAFLQHRIGLFGLVAGGCYLFFLSFRLLFADVWWRPSLGYHLASGLVFMGVWLACRVGQHSLRVLRGIETVGLLLGTGALVVMGAYVEHVARPDFILLLALTVALTARAVYVPSSARRSFALAAAVGVQLLVCVYFSFLDLVPTNWGAVAPEIANQTAAGVARGLTVQAAAWWAMTVAVTTATSRVIYGLRREIRDAKQLGQYLLEHKIGEGGMGTVYQASHALLRRPTAVKLLHAGRASEAQQQRFETEVQHTARLNHPNIVTIFDYGHTPDGVFYYAMELIHGVTLGRLVDVDGPQPVGRVLAILEQVGQALVCAHGEGLVHRDIKPANILLLLPHLYGGQPEQLKLLDFGLVKELKDTGGIDVTHANEIAGTPQYMCPEAISDPTTMDGRGDLYAVGAIGFYLLTGRHVFEGSTVIEVLGQHLLAEPPRPSAYAEVPKALDDLIHRCLAKDPARRPDTALTFLQELESVPDVPPWTPAHALAWWCDKGKTLEATQLSEPTGGLSIQIAGSTELRSTTDDLARHR